MGVQRVAQETAVFLYRVCGYILAAQKGDAVNAQKDLQRPTYEPKDQTRFHPIGETVIPQRLAYLSYTKAKSLLHPVLKCNVCIGRS